MTRFEEYLNSKYKLDNSSVITYNNNSTSSFLRECNEISAKAFTLTSASSVESICDRNETNNIADLDELVKFINEEPTLKKSKKNKNKKNKKNSNKNPLNDNCTDTNINRNILDKLNENINDANKGVNSCFNNIFNNDEEEETLLTDKMVDDFKNELESFSLPSYMIQKITPTLSQEFLNNLDSY